MEAFYKFSQQDEPDVPQKWMDEFKEFEKQLPNCITASMGMYRRDNEL